MEALSSCKGHIRKFIRQFGKNNAILTLGISIVVGTLVCWEAHVILRSERFDLNEPRYLIVRRALSPGNSLSLLDLSFVARVQVHGQIPQGALTDQELHLIRGSTLKVSVAEGGILTAEMLSSPFGVEGLGEIIPRGFRAYPVAQTGGVSVRPGERVDILLRPESTSDRPMTLVEGVRILQVRRQGDTSQAICAVSSSQIRLLEKAQQKGKLALVLRNPHDTISGEDVNAGRMLESPRPKKRIEVYSEGGS